MPITPQQLYSNGNRDTLFNKIVQFPLIRILIALGFIIPVIICFNLLFRNLDPRWTTYIGDIGAVVIIVLYCLSYAYYVKLIEKRTVLELSREGIVKETGIGFLISAVLVILTTILIMLKGSISIVSTNTLEYLIHAFLIFGLLAFVEELIFRGIVLRLLEELVGTWLSIVIVASIFGSVHLIHEEATLSSTVAIALQDLILSGAFILTRRIWLCWGIHWGWNFTQDGVLGMPNAGVELLPSWLNTEIFGPTWLTGGTIGIELSVLGTLLNVLVGIFLIKIAIKKGQIVRPSWQKPIT
ncbi:lysostaphin resistance A-like protein [Candidatus Neomarinimicrobiota bacterium]